VITVAAVGLMVAACDLTSGSPAAEVTTTTAATTPTPAEIRVSTPQLVAIAMRVMDPAGALCDTRRNTGPSDVNGCPYTDRLRAALNARYQQAWSSHSNQSPVLSPGPPCPPPGTTVVSYFVTASGTGGTVALVTTCGGPATDPAASWQKLVIVSSGGSLLVDDILVDPSHTGKPVSVFK
jgi:hypothetical protein